VGVQRKKGALIYDLQLSRFSLLRMITRVNMMQEEMKLGKYIMERTIKLPEPQKELVFPLMKAIERRRSIRKWKDTPLSEQELSNLLWAACGVTKEKYGKVKQKNDSIGV